MGDSGRPIGALMRRFAAPLCVLALAACTVGPNYRPPAPAALSVPADLLPARRAGRARRSLALVGAVQRSPADPADRRGERRPISISPSPRPGWCRRANRWSRRGPGWCRRSAPRPASGRSFGAGNDHTSFSVGADASLGGRSVRPHPPRHRGGRGRCARASITTARRCASRSPPSSPPIMSRPGWPRSGWRSPARLSPSPTTICRSRNGGVQAGLVSSLDSRAGPRRPRPDRGDDSEPARRVSPAPPTGSRCSPAGRRAR